MSLNDARAETRLPAQDLDRARRWYAEKLGLEPAEERPSGLRYQCASGVLASSIPAVHPTERSRNSR